MAGFPAVRMRRLRDRPALRRLVAETRLSADALVQPLFVVPGRGVRRALPALPGQFHLSVDEVAREAETLAGAGVPAALLFGVPDRKDPDGRGAFDEDGIVPQSVRAIRRAVGDRLGVLTDVCLCAYMPHGHCGVVREGRVDNDATLEVLARVARSHAAAGADMVAPSDMMDGRVGAIRRALDGAGFGGTAILSYSAKYASAFYGPFREAAGSAPEGFGRAGYQMDAGNRREAMREIALDLEEGADMAMVKPALAYLDVIREAAGRFDAPIAAFNVSGEYAAVVAAARNGWLDERSAALEILTAIRRAGASVVLTYWARAAAAWLRDAEAVPRPAAVAAKRGMRRGEGPAV